MGTGLAVAVIAAAAAGVLWFRAGDTSAHTHATITARGDASYTAVSSAPDEIVHLAHGTIDVAVAPLHAGERFRVIAGDAEVEVRGTAFEVVAAHGKLVSVDVQHGKVEVRPRGRPATFLGAGDTWRADPPKHATAIVEVQPPPPPPPTKPTPWSSSRSTGSASRSPSPSSAESSLPSSTPPPSRTRAAGDRAYDDAWTAMRARDFAGAARSFARVLIVAPDGALAEDAAFWQAVALARGLRSAQAVTAFRDFLDAHPRSAHAGEASAMLGWLLLDSGERAEAVKRFRAATGDPNKSVRDSARSGLQAATAVDHVRDDR
ncbi:MAG: FecR domain-containing protein [Deltaproteobacteria bacterium]|nr:FecR domain-containing protein [Deltaproteobacteria bacterium]